MPDDTGIDRALLLGTQYFKQGEYQQARALFQKALRACKSKSQDDLRTIYEARYGAVPTGTLHHPRMIKLMDNICACWEKIGDFELCHRTASKMIDLEPENIKCYIRMGRILQKQERLLEAYHNYKQGLRMCVGAGAKFKILTQEQLSSVRTKLQAQQTEPIKRKIIDPIEENARILKKRRDPPIGQSLNLTIDFLSKLPIELVSCILKDFTAKELIPLLYVSKDWMRTLYQCPRLFRNFQLNVSLRDMMKFNGFMQKLDRLQVLPLLDLIKVSARNPSEEFKIVDILFGQLPNIHCRRLILTIPSCTTSELYKCLRSKSSINFKSLNELSIIMSLRADRFLELDALSRFPNLKRIELVFTNAVVPINYTNDVDLSVCHLNTHWCYNLESLNVICAQRVNYLPLSPLLSKFPENHLKKISITGVKFPQQFIDYSWLRRLPTIEELWLENNQNAPFQNFLKLCRDSHVFMNLNRIVFREEHSNPKFDLESPSTEFYYESNFSLLEDLDIMGTSISGKGLRRLLSYMGKDKIKKLNIGDCPNIRFMAHRFSSSDMDSSILPMPYFVENIESLEELYLPQSSVIDDDSVKLLLGDISQLENFRNLDLSFNPYITGVSVYELLRTFKEERQRTLDYLNINACPSVSHLTVNMIKSKKLVKSIDCSYDKDVWKQFGINSLKYTTL